MSQQVTKEKYSIETLRERNVSYDHQHWLTQKDVDMANNYVELIERTRSEITPQIGDRLVYVTEHGDYYGNALIDSRRESGGTEIPEMDGRGVQGLGALRCLRQRFGVISG